MALDPSSFASVTPAGAAASILSAAASTPASSAATGAPATSGPKTINISGFGGRSSGSATQSLTQGEPDRGGSFPMSAVGDLAVPSWVLPAVVAVLAIALVGAFVRRK